MHLIRSAYQKEARHQRHNLSLQLACSPTLLLFVFEKQRRNETRKNLSIILREISNEVVIH